jgi:hypothetical protein
MVLLKYSLINIFGRLRASPKEPNGGGMVQVECILQNKLLNKYVTQITFILILAGNFWWVWYVHLATPGTERAQYFSLAALAVTISIAMKKLAPSFFSYPKAIAITLFTLMWGRVIFCGYIYYDELDRFSSLPSLKNFILTPVNDHLTPVMWILWWLQYDFLGGNYFAIACSHYLFGVLLVSSVVGIIENILPENTEAVLLGSLIASVSTLSYRIWVWKGCGDSPVVSLALLFLLYYLCLRSEGNPSRKLAFVTLYVLITFSCSATTLSFLFIIPLLLVAKFRNRHFISLLAMFFTVSVGYWLLRLSIVHETRPHYLEDLPGAFKTVWVTYSGSNIIGGYVLIAVFYGLIAVVLTGLSAQR